ncbi:MAG: hypothetical protein N2578_10110, partial [Bdellovibrionaceae bacterium]|nr:hypothetical protein [Pseudobdellovibrionaceae bacterium]
MNIKAGHLWLGLSALVGTYIVGCADVKFTQEPPNLCHSATGNCVQTNSTDVIQVETVLGGKVDLLIINDNSASCL